MKNVLTIVLFIIIFVSNAFAQEQLIVPQEIVERMKKTECQIAASYVSTQSNFVSLEIDNQKMPKCIIVSVATDHQSLIFVVKTPYNHQVWADFSDEQLQIYRHQEEHEYSEFNTHLWNCFNLGRANWLIVKIFFENKDSKIQGKQKIFIGARARQ